jgi:hypothetical protein
MTTKCKFCGSNLVKKTCNNCNILIVSNELVSYLASYIVDLNFTTKISEIYKFTNDNNKYYVNYSFDNNMLYLYEYFCDTDGSILGELLLQLVVEPNIDLIKTTAFKYIKYHQVL